MKKAYRNVSLNLGAVSEIRNRLSLVVSMLFLTIALSASAQPQYRQISNTPHNLSITGPGTIRASQESQVCIFCHTPHSASVEAPLWNRELSAVYYTTYPSGGSMQASVGQPEGSSRICLSCHDGTIALGLVLSQPSQISMTGTTALGMMPPGSANLGSVLYDDHPISMELSTEDLEISAPPVGSAVKLDRHNVVQCRSCHDPHNNTEGKFLVMNPAQGALCVTCHVKSGWNVSEHSHPTSSQHRQLVDQACSSCHVDHGAPAPRLLRQSEENLCYTCHDGNRNSALETVGATEIVTVFNKASRHPVALTNGIHDAGEGPLNSTPPPSSYLPEQSPTVTRHVECADCHNAHAVTNTDTIGQINGTLRQEWGVTISGVKISPATYEYQICLKCHGDSQNLPPNEINKRTEFDPLNRSFHPVVAPGTNSFVPGLLAPWTATSTMNCTSCHGNNDPSGAQGPHGSDYTPLLKNQYTATSGTAEGSSTYALCYSCHDRTTLFNATLSRFPNHSAHVVTNQFSCKTCHNSHGSRNYHLINFDLTDPRILPAPSGRLEFVDQGANHGSCYITCHSHTHDPANY